MLNMTQRRGLMKPISVGGDIVLKSVEELVGAIISSSNLQAKAKENVIKDVEEQVDFLQACDTFNVWRMRWRLEEEFENEDVVRETIDQVSDLICSERNYNREEFGLALEATQERARFPFGLDPLEYANLLAQKKPIRVLRTDLDSISQRILGIAVHLQVINGPRPVLLPIEQLRTVLKCRKLVVGGAVKRLLNQNLLADIGEKAHSGKAREFRVIAKEGTDYELAS